MNAASLGIGGIDVENLHHAYDGLTVVRGVSFSVKPGTLTCLLGPSGCGKTTLLRLAAGLEIVQAGSVTIGETVVGDGGQGLHIAPENRGVGLMFQDYALFPHLTILENVIFGLSDNAKARAEWAKSSLRRMGLGYLVDAYPHTLSGGQQQRVALLRALAPEPRVLLLDEPFSGMDVTLRAAVREETLSILKETGVAAVMVTHDPEEAMFMADEILIMNEGRIVQAGTPVETYFNPANAFVANLFGPVNRIDGTVSAGVVETALGRFPAVNIDEGTPVRVFIRPEGLKLAVVDAATADGERVATVMSARLLGRSSHIRLRCATTDGSIEGPRSEMQARVPGVFLPDVNTQVSVALDPRQVFVFPAT